VQLAHDREDGEHLLGRFRGVAPAAAVVGHLRDLLARAKTVEDRATREAVLA
jgi:hypothetical protein